jgi:O-antigen/teichoic acid export membrane protein
LQAESQDSGRRSERNPPFESFRKRAAMPIEMKRRQILLNAATTFGQVIGSAAILFFLYRFLIRSIGIERLGIWSLVLAATSIVTLANSGFSVSIVKFVAKYAACENGKGVSDLVQTALISVGLVVSVLSAALYPGAKWLLEIILPSARVPEAIAILPLALASLWINLIVSVLQAGLAGHELISECNFVELGGSAAYLLSAFLFVPTCGLLGLAYSQTAVAILSALATWLLLRRRIPHFPFFPRRWNRKLFREMVGYGLHFEFITMSQAMREPVTKALLTKFGGLALVGYYDLASRWVVNFREMIVQTNQVLVPTVSRLREREPGSIPFLYRESYRLIFFISIPSFAILIALSPLASLFWIGRFEPVFITFVVLLAAGWLTNILANPAYVVDLGTGALKWVSAGCAVTAILNAALGYFGGKHWGGTAVVAASVFSLAFGYMIVLASYHLENHVPFAQLLPKESSGIVIASLVGALIFLPFFSHSKNWSLLSPPVVALAVLLAMIAIPMWVHPLRKRLLHWVFSRVAA